MPSGSESKPDVGCYLPTPEEIEQGKRAALLKRIENKADHHSNETNRGPKQANIREYATVASGRKGNYTFQI